MPYDPAQVKSAAELSALVHGVVELEEVLHTLQGLKLKSFLYGGAVRDLLAFGRPTGDYDLITVPAAAQGVCDTSQFEIAVSACAARLGCECAIYKNHHIAFSRPGSGLSFDVHYPCQDPVEKLIRSDFTINGIAFDCEKNGLFDPFGGLADLKNRRLHIHSPEYVITNPPNFPRMFRTAYRMGLKITGETEAVIRKYAHLISLHDGKTNVRTMLELLKFFSQPALQGYLYQFNELGLVSYLVPELAPLAELAAPSSSQLTQNILAAERLDQGPFGAAWEGVLSKAVDLGISQRGILRFVLLFDGLGQAYAALGRGSPFSQHVSGGDPTAFARRMQENLTNHAAARYREIPTVYAAMREMNQVFALSGSLLSKAGVAGTGALSELSQAYEPGLLRKACLLSYARLAGGFLLPELPA